MGNKVAAFSEEQLNEYQACTFLTRKNILRAERLFRQISNDRWPEVVTRECASSFSVPYSSLDSLTELKENPFRRRVCQIFSTDGSASLTFDQFLEMFSVFSEHAPRDIKAIYAFRLYDFDSDGYLSEQDLLHTVKHLTLDLLNPDEYSTIVAKVLEEGDVDCDGRISQSEFIHVILKSPDFVPNFHIRI
ncbi:calcium and integrin-binding family member 3-like [Homarus americanus]|uniref:calcium and integrin-binding family member 3-like n=1 Tax=Homarus americanus TaxID=6706 RepID=UPI001C48F3CA|nr:calcium and integrin-binding family member 3-like [Homarus americanus]